eukprot:ANDGO_05800.mRNA.1 26S proteasome non-ATPase regulatory subunit 10
MSSVDERLLEACRTKQDIFEFLRSHEMANVHFRDADGRTAVHWAAASGHLSGVETLLQRGAQAESTDEGGWTPLISAASAGHADVVQELLRHGADANSITEDKRSALMYAVSKGHMRVIEMLLGAHARINMRDSTGSGPLHRALATNRLEIADMLIRKGADVDDAALELVIGDRNVEGIRLLMDHGASQERVQTIAAGLGIKIE